MVKYCCVDTCSLSWNPRSDVSFFSFPWKNGDLMTEWLKVISTKCKITKYSSICSTHFEETDFELVAGRRRLKKDAIPTIFALEKPISRNLFMHCKKPRVSKINEQKITELDENIDLSENKDIEAQNSDLIVEINDEGIPDENSSNRRKVEVKIFGKITSPYSICSTEDKPTALRKLRTLQRRLLKQKEEILKRTQLNLEERNS